MDGFSQPLSAPWAEKTVGSFSDQLLKEVFASNTWLEQEAIILGKRLETELEMLVAGRK